jgi:hypothetical protein
LENGNTLLKDKGMVRGTCRGRVRGKSRVMVSVIVRIDPGGEHLVRRLHPKCRHPFDNIL